MKNLQTVILEKLRLDKNINIPTYNIQSYDNFLEKYDVRYSNRTKPIYCALNIKTDLMKKITKQIKSNHDKLYTDICKFIETANQKDLDDYSYTITNNESSINYIRIKNKNTTWPILLECQLSKIENPNIYYTFRNGLNENEIERLEIIILNIIDFIINYNK